MRNRSSSNTRPPHHAAALALPALAFLACAPFVLHAQDPPDAESTSEDGEPASSTTLPATVITSRTTELGTRTEKQIEEVPVSVSVITPEDIARIAPLSFDDLIRTVPNVETQGGPRFLGEQVVVRGEGGNAVTVRIDDARQNFVSGHAGQRFFVETDFLRGIDILRGAGSFLYGSGSAGVINLTTFDPADLLNEGGVYGARLRNTYNHNSEAWAHSLLGAVSGDTLAFMAGRSWRLGNNIRLADNVELPNSAIERDSNIAKLVWTPSDAHRLEVGYLTYDSDDEGGANPQTNVSVANALVARQIEYRQWTGQYQFDPSANDLVNVDLTVYYNETIQDRDYLATTGNNVGRRNVHALDVFGVDFANRSEFVLGGLEHDLVFGFEYYGETQDGNESRATFFIPGGAGNSSGRPDAEADHYGIFLTDETDLTDRFTLFAGVRYDGYSTEKTIGSPAAQDDGAISPNVGFDFDVTETLSVVGRYSRAFTEPTLNLLYQDGSHFGRVPVAFHPIFGFPTAFFEEVFVPNPNLKPETSDNFELGLRYENEHSLAGAVVSQLTGFYKKGEDTVDTEIVGTQVDPNFGGPGVPLTQAFRQAVNREETEIYGMEFSLDYDADLWFANFTAGSVRGRDTVTGLELNSITGDQITTTLGTRLAEGVELGVYGIWNSGREEFVTDPSLKTSAYDIYGVFAAFQVLTNWELRFGIDNLADQAYERTSIFQEEPGRNVFVSSTLTW